MAFHSKDGSIARSARTHRRDKESILGLSGWLFADLLLAIAVIFLVVETKATADEGSTPITTTTSTTTSTVAPPPAKTVGLIANLEEQLFVRVTGGANLQTWDSWENTLASSRTQIFLGAKNRIARNGTTWSKLKEDGYRVGFVMWFAKTNARSKNTSKDGLPNLVKFLRGEGLIDKRQTPNGDYSSFPHIPDYSNNSLGKSDLEFRLFLFQPQS
jgi:hypothetical protein